MKLIYTPTSPYARKPRMIMFEKGLEDRFELETVDFQNDRAMLNSINPVGKVPVLITTEGEVIHDSPVICEFIDSLSAVRPVIPPAGAERWRSLSDQATADGLMDAAVSLMVSQRVMGENAPDVLTSLWEDKIHGALNEMDTRAAQFGEAFDIGQISCLAAIDYLMLRFPKIHWRPGRPNLALWYDQKCERPSALATRPIE